MKPLIIFILKIFATSIISITVWLSWIVALILWDKKIFWHPLTAYDIIWKNNQK